MPEQVVVFMAQKRFVRAETGKSYVISNNYERASQIDWISVASVIPILNCAGLISIRYEGKTIHFLVRTALLRGGRLDALVDRQLTGRRQADE